MIFVQKNFFYEITNHNVKLKKKSGKPEEKYNSSLEYRRYVQNNIHVYSKKFHATGISSMNAKIFILIIYKSFIFT